MIKNISLAMPMLSAGSLESYTHAVSRLPILTAEAEQELAVRFREEGDLDAARNLILAHLRFVVHIARGYTGYGLPQADLIQEGNIGLMKAVKRFDPSLNVRLVSFAVHWIRAEIHEFILRNWRIVKVATTKAQRKLFFNLRSAKKRLTHFSKEEVETVAKDLGVSPATVVEMEMRMGGHDTSFDPYEEHSEGEDSRAAAPVAYLADLRSDPQRLLEDSDWEVQNTDRLQAALANLDDRSRNILEKRWLTDEKSTLQDLAAQYSVSAERIRQLEQSAMKKIKNVLDA